MRGSDAGRAGYWDRNLDPQNLGSEADPAAALLAEAPFHDVPDQAAAIAAMGPLDGALVLELGTGLGLNALNLARRGARVVATDISLERLRALRAILRDGRHAELWRSDHGAVLPVRCAAEALPFRADAFDAACSRSVLIHTRLPEAAAEIRRTMRPGATGAFIEPMTSNPLVVLYRRTLAPAEWRGITTYFSPREIAALSAPFASAATRHFYLSAFLAFAWQFGVRAPALFRPALALLNALDNGLMGVVPALRRFAWFVLVVVRK